MKKIIVVCILIIVISLCSISVLLHTDSRKSIKNEKSEFTVGMVESLSESSWKDAVYNSVQTAAEENNVQLMTIRTKRTLDEQIQAVRSFITYHVDAIIVTPVVVSEWSNVLQEAKEAGIPLILVEQKVKEEDSQDITTYIGSDFVSQGEKAATFIMEQFEDSDETVNIVELHGTVGASSTSERNRGINSILHKNDKYDIFYTVSCDGMSSKAKEILGMFLNNNAVPDVVISFNDAMTIGAIEAMKECGIKPGVDIMIVSFDGQQDAVDLLKNGEINCIVETNPFVGYQIMDTVLKLCQGETISSDILIEDQVFTIEDDLTQLGERGY